MLDRLNDSGELYLSHATVGDRMALRLAIGAPSTRREHIEAAWAAIRAALPPGNDQVT